MHESRDENQRLRRILQIARQMAVTPDLDTLLRTIVDAACEIMECERATIFLYDAARDELFSRVAKGEAGIRFPADRGIAGSAAKQRACVNVPDAYADVRFNREVDKKTGFTTRNLLTVPMENLDGALIGVMQLLNKRDGAFGGTDE
ncbi:MAG: GAF domain-containing protein, partial [Phycisphaerae bacterium]